MKFGILTLIVFFTLMGCTQSLGYLRVNHDDPIIRLAIKQCGIDTTDPTDYACYLNIALENKKPETCLLANASVDDWCVSDYIEKRKSPSACEEIKNVKAGLLDDCMGYYKTK